MKLKLGSVVTHNSIILDQGEESIIYEWNIIFSKTCVALLMVSEFNFFCQKNNCSANLKFILCQEVEQWQWLIVPMWQLVEISWEIAVYAYRNTSNFKLEELRFPKIILSDLVRKDVTEFNDKFYHFQYATQETFKGPFKNYSVLKLRFFINTYTFLMYCKNVSHQYYATNEATKPRILL